MCSIGAIHHPPIEVSVFLHSFKIKKNMMEGFKNAFISEVSTEGF